MCAFPDTGTGDLMSFMLMILEPVGQRQQRGLAKEMISGFFLISCKTRKWALAIAAKCPTTEWCTIEVREAAPCFA